MRDNLLDHPLGPMFCPHRGVYGAENTGRWHHQTNRKLVQKDNCGGVGRGVARPETGGPPITEPKELRGFGSKLLSRSVSGQLAGEVTYDWQQTGLVVMLRMRQDRLAN